MRDARAADSLRRLVTQRASWKTKVQRIAVDEVPTVGTLELPVQSPLTVVAGPNGVGKTTLLRAVWAALDPDAAKEVVTTAKRFSAGTATVDVTTSGTAESAEVRFIPDELAVISRSSVIVTHVDSAARTKILQDALSQFESVDEIVNGEGPRELDSKALAEVSYVTKRAYRSVTLYEVDLDGTVPFFEVSYGNDTYDSRTMGGGEFAALYVWWAVRRSESDSVILIEEPEAYLSYGCQKALASFLVNVVVERRLVAIVTSHSSAFITSLPKDSLVFLTRGQGGVSLLSEAPPVFFKTMGIEPPIAVYAFVEDSLGRVFLRSILERLDPLLSRQVFIDQRNGDGEVRSALKAMRSNSGPIRFVGMFDGDLRNTDLGELATVSSFLPGEKPAEIAFREIIISNPSSLSSIVNNPHVATILSSLEGKDHHDWYEELARELGLSRDQLFSALFSVWLTKPGSEEAAKGTYDSLLALIA